MRFDLLEFVGKTSKEMNTNNMFFLFMYVNQDSVYGGRPKQDFFYLCVSIKIFVLYRFVVNFLCEYLAYKILVILNYISNLNNPGKYTINLE